MRKNLVKARKLHKMTQREVAAKLQITTRQYQRIETGEISGKITTWDTLEDLFHLPQRQLREISQITKTKKPASQ